MHSFEVGELVVTPSGRNGRIVANCGTFCAVTLGDPDSSYDAIAREFVVIAVRTEDLHGA